MKKHRCELINNLSDPEIDFQHFSQCFDVKEDGLCVRGAAYADVIFPAPATVFVELAHISISCITAEQAETSRNIHTQAMCG